MKRLCAIAAVAMLSVPGRLSADERFRPYAAVGVEEVYDSNVHNGKGPDAVTRVAPRAGLILDGETLGLGLEYRAALHEYADGKAPGSVNHRAAGFGRLRLSRRFDVKADGVFLVADDPILLDRPGVAVPQGGFSDLLLGGGFTGRATRRLTVDGRYSYRRSRFELSTLPGGLAYDGDEHRVDGDLSYRVSHRINLLGAARYEHFVSAASTDDAIGAGLGTELAFTHRTRLRLLLGPLDFTGQTVTWFGKAQIRHTLERGRLTFDLVRDLYGGTGASQALWSDSANLSGFYLLGRRTVVRGRLSGYLSGVAPDADASVAGVLGRAELGWLIFRKQVLVDLYAEHRVQGTNGSPTFGDVQRTFVGAQLLFAAGADVLAIGEVP